MTAVPIRSLDKAEHLTRPYEVIVESDGRTCATWQGSASTSGDAIDRALALTQMAFKVRGGQPGVLKATATPRDEELVCEALTVTDVIGDLPGPTTFDPDSAKVVLRSIVKLALRDARLAATGFAGAAMGPIRVNMRLSGGPTDRVFASAVFRHEPAGGEADTLPLGRALANAALAIALMAPNAKKGVMIVVKIEGSATLRIMQHEEIKGNAGRHAAVIASYLRLIGLRDEADAVDAEFSG